MDCCTIDSLIASIGLIYHTVNLKGGEYEITDVLLFIIDEEYEKAINNVLETYKIDN